MDASPASRTGAPAPTAGFLRRAAASTVRFVRGAPGYFQSREPTFEAAFGPALLVTVILFLRNPFSNYIFDEQEALLANPFVNGKVPWRDILARDFWGLPHDRSIGSYRPLPNLVWRAVWQLGTPMHQPWTLHWINVVVHAVNAACITRIAWGLTRDRRASWLAGAAFVTSAVLTEAVTGVVGIADVFGALGLLVAVLALEKSLPLMGLSVFGAVTLGLFSKESTLVAIPIVAWFALVAAPIHHPGRPLRAVRATVALLAAVAALGVYTETRRRFFPSALPAHLEMPLPATEPLVKRAFHAFLAWFHQPRLPQDPINNPLVDADTPHRVSGALGVYASGLLQVVFPWRLSGDYSFAAEPVPARLFNVRSVIGAFALLVPPLVGFFAWCAGVVREHEHRQVAPGGEAPPFDPRAHLGTLAVLAIALVWVPVAYFPHSNIPVTLPTVRAERFWYLPVAGAALALGLVLSAFFRRPRLLVLGKSLPVVVVAFLGFQAIRARVHAFDYIDDLVFWRATASAVPASAKAHLNYGVMLGARGRLEDRLVENRRAMELAPRWPMAHIYYADTLCRLDRTDEAWPGYRKGLELGPNDRNLISLALQCLWDHHAFDRHAEELTRIADAHPGSWVSYLVRDVVQNGEANGGVDRKYRPRGYDDGPSE